MYGHLCKMTILEKRMTHIIRAEYNKKRKSISML